MEQNMGEVVWVTGAAGLIGGELIRNARHWSPGSNVIGLTRQDVDLTNAMAVQARFAQDRPTTILHCAAMSRSPACEKTPDVAHVNNVEATRNLVELSGDVRFLFLSTDLVFDGKKGTYHEEDPVNPLGVYARTKALAEDVVRTHPRHLILRTSLNYGHSPSADRAFNEEMVQAWKQGKVLKLFVDEYRCPIPVPVTARAIWRLVNQPLVGTYHVAGAEKLSRWQIGQVLARRHPELQPRIEASSVKDWTGGPRSPDVALDISRVTPYLDFRLPGWTQWLDEHEPVRS